MLSSHRRRHSLIGLLLCIGALLVAVPAANAGQVVNDPNCQTNTLAANDDSSTDLVDIGFTANAYGLEFSQVYVNNNGNVTVTGPKGEYTPYDFTIGGEPIIAPFFADVDTTGDGSSLVTYGTTTFGGHPAFCVNWVDVGYFGSHADKLNSFQLLLVKRDDTGDAGNFDVIFNYDKIQWEAGDASGGNGGLGGTSAAFGLTNADGDPAHSFMGEGSFINGALLDGGPSALIGQSNAGTPGRFLFPVRNTPPTGVHLTGVVQNSALDPIAGAPVQICTHGTDSCITRLTGGDGHYSALNLANGTYDITGFPGPGVEYLPATVQTVINGNPGDSATQDITLGDPPGPPPAGTTLTNIGTTDGGLPVVYWDDPLALTTQGCPGATTATYTIEVEGQVVKSGNLTEGPAGTYTANTTSVYPHHGAGLVHIVIDCGGGPTSTDFGIYIDPSGAVKDTSGQPVEGATVILFRSSSPTGPFSPVPNGSVVMSPGNRQNPWSTGSDGAFHWDVVAGYYKVRAQKDGCTGSPDRSVGYAETGVLTIPPPVTDLVLTLDCTAQSTPTPPAPVVNPPAAGDSASAPSGNTPVPPAATPATPTAVSIGKLAAVKVLKGRSAVVTVSCLASAKTACAGKASLKVLAKVKKKTKSVAAGSKSFKGLKPGKSLKLTIKLSPAARKLGRSKGAKLKATTSIQDGAGNRQTLTRTIKVKLR